MSSVFCVLAVNGHYVDSYELYTQADNPTRGIWLGVRGNVGLLAFDLQMTIPADGIGIYGTINTSQGANPAAIRTFIDPDGRVGLFCGEMDVWQIVGTMAFLVRRSDSS